MPEPAAWVPAGPARAPTHSGMLNMHILPAPAIPQAPMPFHSHSLVPGNGNMEGNVGGIPLRNWAGPGHTATFLS